MTDIQARVRAQLRARLKASGAAEFADDQLFTDVDAIFRQALSNDDPGALVLPALLPRTGIRSCRCGCRVIAAGWAR